MFICGNITPLLSKCCKTDTYFAPFISLVSRYENRLILTLDSIQSALLSDSQHSTLNSTKSSACVNWMRFPTLSPCSLDYGLPTVTDWVANKYWQRAISDWHWSAVAVADTHQCFTASSHILYYTLFELFMIYTKGHESLIIHILCMMCEYHKHIFASQKIPFWSLQSHDWHWFLYFTVSCYDLKYMNV